MSDVSPDDLTARVYPVWDEPGAGGIEIDGVRLIDFSLPVDWSDPWHPVIDARALALVDSLPRLVQERELAYGMARDREAERDALSADVARLEAERDEWNCKAVAHAARWVAAEVERDEALSRVAEHAATIERLRDAVEGLLRIAPRHRMEYEHDRTVCPYCSVTAPASAVLADTAPTPETSND